MIAFLLRSLVYVQSFIWLIILFSDIVIENEKDDKSIAFIIYSLMVYVFVLQYQLSFSQYPTRILQLYILMVIVTFGLLSSEYRFKEALCLSFLIVFINSYYWEMMLHINAIIFNGLNFNQIVQAFHLIPAYFLYKRITFKHPKRVLKMLLYGLFVSALNVSLIGLPYSTERNQLNRLFSLGVLILIFLNEVKKRDGRILFR
jgi:hypothetical protein